MSELTLKVAVSTVADDNLCDIFLHVTWGDKAWHARIQKIIPEGVQLRQRFFVLVLV